MHASFKDTVKILFKRELQRLIARILISNNLFDVTFIVN